MNKRLRQSVFEDVYLYDLETGCLSLLLLEIEVQ